MDVPLSVILGAGAIGVALPLLVFGLSRSAESRPDPVRLNLSGDRLLTDQRQRVLQESAIDRAVRPAIRSDGGDVEFVGFDEEEGLVQVRMVGARPFSLHHDLQVRAPCLNHHNTFARRAFRSRATTHRIARASARLPPFIPEMIAVLAIESAM